MPPSDDNASPLPAPLDAEVPHVQRLAGLLLDCVQETSDACMRLLDEVPPHVRDMSVDDFVASAPSLLQ